MNKNEKPKLSTLPFLVPIFVLMGVIAIFPHYFFGKKDPAPPQTQLQDTSIEALAIQSYALMYDYHLKNALSITNNVGFTIQVGNEPGGIFHPTLDQLKAFGFAPDQATGAMYKIDRVPANCKGFECHLKVYMLKNGHKVLLTTDDPINME